MSVESIDWLLNGDEHDQPHPLPADESRRPDAGLLRMSDDWSG